MVRSFIRNLYSGPLAVQLRRFVVVGAAAAGIQTILLWLFVDRIRLNIIVAAVIAIEVTIIMQYVVNNAWTFRETKNTGKEYVVGLLKTNVVRGSAMPIQLGVLFVLVDWRSVPVLLANGVAIVVSGIYRYVLDSQWTFG